MSEIDFVLRLTRFRIPYHVSRWALNGIAPHTVNWARRRRALLAGVGRGIGLARAAAFAQAGAHVVLIARGIAVLGGSYQWANPVIATAPDAVIRLQNKGPGSSECWGPATGIHRPRQAQYPFESRWRYRRRRPLLQQQ